MRLEFNNCPNRFRFRGSINELPYCNGGFAEYYYLFPGHFVFKVPDELPEEATTSVNCALSQVIYGLQQGGMKIGDSVVIQGAGGLGINAAAARPRFPPVAAVGLLSRLYDERRLLRSGHRAVRHRLRQRVRRLPAADHVVESVKEL